MELTSIDKLKRHLQITDTSEDARLTQLANEVEAGIKSYLGGRRLAQHTVTNEYHDGHGRQILILKQRPATAVSDLRVDTTGYSGQSATAFGSGTVWTMGTAAFLRRTVADESNPGELIAVSNGGVWPVGIGNIRVTYTAGYATIPLDIELIVHQLVTRVRVDASKGRPVMSERLGSYSYSLLSAKDESTELTSARHVLQRYRSIRL